MQGGKKKTMTIIDWSIWLANIVVPVGSAILFALIYFGKSRERALACQVALILGALLWIGLRSVKLWAFDPHAFWIFTIPGVGLILLSLRRDSRKLQRGKN
jgi:hypothetical protein